MREAERPSWSCRVVVVAELVVVLALEAPTVELTFVGVGD